MAEGTAGVMNIDKIHRYDFTLPDKREDTPLLWGRKIWSFWDVRRMPDGFQTKSRLYIRGQNLRTRRFGSNCDDLWRQEYWIIPSWRPTCCRERMVLRYMAREVL